MESKKIKLLIIDDNLEECSLLRDFFNIQYNIEVCGIAIDGVEGIRKARETNPDVVITDFVMPNIDGSEVIKNIKSVNSNIKVIVLSGLGDTRIADYALKNGADYYLMKPISLPFLLEKIVFIHNIGLNSENIYEKGKHLISKFVEELGVSLTLSGYDYIVQALEIMLEGKRGLMLKEVNNIISNRNNISVRSVETCIHNAIEKAHQSKTLKYVDLFGNSENAPSNFLFLRIVKENLLRSNEHNCNQS